MQTQSNIDNITALFTTQPRDMPPISTATEAPSYTSLEAFQDKLDVNAMNIPSWSTKLGHLYLTIETADFTKANGSAVTDPTDPGNIATAPTPVVRVATRAAIAAAAAAGDPAPGDVTLPIDPFAAQEAIRVHQQEQNEYITFITTKTILQAMIINSVDDQYINKLCNPVTKYALVTPLQLLTHLWNTYGKIDQGDLSANEERMKAPWSPPTPIETLFKQMSTGQKFAAKGKETISDNQIVRYTYDAIVATGLFTNACTKWRAKDAADRTWDECMTFFSKADKDRNKNLTTSEGTYTANQVEELIRNQLDSMVVPAEIYEAEQAAAAATAAATTNTSTPTGITNESPTAAANAVTADNIRTIFQDLLAADNRNRNNNRNRYNNNNRYNNRNNNRHNNNRPDNNRTNNNTRNNLPTIQGYDEEGNPVSYCFTHGITKNLRHCSRSCTRKCEGHQDNATLNNQMGGKTARCEART